MTADDLRRLRARMDRLTRGLRAYDIANHRGKYACLRDETVAVLLLVDDALAALEQERFTQREVIRAVLEVGCKVEAYGDIRERLDHQSAAVGSPQLSASATSHGEALPRSAAGPTSAGAEMRQDCALQLLEIAEILVKSGRICGNDERVPDVVAEQLRELRRWRNGEIDRRERLSADPSPAGPTLVEEIDAWMTTPDAMVRSAANLLQRARDYIAFNEQWASMYDAQTKRIAALEERLNFTEERRAAGEATVLEQERELARLRAGPSDEEVEMTAQALRGRGTIVEAHAADLIERLRAGPTSEEVETQCETLCSFSRAYPEDIFTPITDEESAAHKGTGFMDRVSAQMGRHCAKFMGQAADLIKRQAAALAAAKAERDEARAVLRAFAENRCYACGWPLVANADDGCVPFNCSMRVPEHSEDYQRVHPRAVQMQTVLDAARAQSEQEGKE